jgi:hypothetical protein
LINTDTLKKWGYIFFIPVVSDESMEGVGHGNPANQTAAVGKPSRQELQKKNSSEICEIKTGKAKLQKIYVTTQKKYQTDGNRCLAKTDVKHYER